MKVLIVKVSALGDVVHALPVLAWLKSADPEMEIDWLMEESFAPLLDGHPLIRRVHRLRTRAWRRDGPGAGIRGSLETVGRLRREAYDVVLDLQGNSKSALFTLLTEPAGHQSKSRPGNGKPSHHRSFAGDCPEGIPGRDAASRSRSPAHRRKGPFGG
jgi:heptosyltransferase-1